MGSLLFKVIKTSLIVLLVYVNILKAETSSQKSGHGIFLPAETGTNSFIYYGEILAGDAEALSRLIKTNHVENIIISSPGGLVYEALDIAYLVKENRISILIPKDQFCLSACAFIFFAGNARVSDGELGVHQVNFSGSAAKRIGKLREITRDSQLVVSDIISALNRFGVPQFVYERMFATEDMYFFTSEEIREIERRPNYFTNFQRLKFSENMKGLEAEYISKDKQKFYLPSIAKKLGHCLSQMGRPSILSCF